VSCTFDDVFEISTMIAGVITHAIILTTYGILAHITPNGIGVNVCVVQSEVYRHPSSREASQLSARRRDSLMVAPRERERERDRGETVSSILLDSHRFVELSNPRGQVRTTVKDQKIGVECLLLFATSTNSIGSRSSPFSTSFHRPLARIVAH